MSTGLLKVSSVRLTERLTLLFVHFLLVPRLSSLTENQYFILTSANAALNLCQVPIKISYLFCKKLTVTIITSTKIRQH